MPIRAETVEPGVVAGAVKLFMDGVIESGTAALIEPYGPLASESRPAPNPKGLPNFTDERCRRS